MIKKIILALLILIQSSCNLTTINCCKPDIEESNDLRENFKPDYLITEQTPEDLTVLKAMKDLFFEPDPVLNAQNPEITCTSERDVYNKAIDNYGAQEVILRPSEDLRLSSLYFKNPNALYNIIYVTGYFADETPTGKWAAPFWPLHNAEVENSETIPVNMLVFDWRGFGFSEGRHDFLNKDFGSNAYPDVQAAIDFIRKDNDKPLVLVGFCAGAAMVMQTTVQAQKNGANVADALVLNSIFTTFEEQLKKAYSAANKLSHKFILGSGVVNLLDKTLNGSLFDLKPIEMIEKINVPCLFEHYADDPFAVLDGAIEVYNKAKELNKNTRFLLSNLGRHARIHSKVPYQYRNFFNKFLIDSKILEENYNQKSLSNTNNPSSSLTENAALDITLDTSIEKSNF